MQYNYYIIYKPFGYLSQFSKENPNDVTLADIEFDFPKDVYPVGRLDKDSEGLLLLTNDKSLNQQLLNPESHYVKRYWVQVEGTVTPSAKEQLQKGVVIRIKKKDYKTRPARVRILENIEMPERNPPIRYRKSIPTTWIEILLEEGKNRQVRRMTAKVGFPTLRLIRTGIGKLEIGEMQIGEVKVVSRDDFDLS